MGRGGLHSDQEHTNQAMTNRIQLAAFLTCYDTDRLSCSESWQLVFQVHAVSSFVTAGLPRNLALGPLDGSVMFARATPPPPPPASRLEQQVKMLRGGCVVVFEGPLC